MILLVRHPAVAAGGRCYGRLDLPVADPASVNDLASGIGAQLALAPAQGEWTVWTSPAQRCRRVAEALGAHRVDDRLQELDFGAWEGLAWDAVPRASLDAWAADPWGFAPPRGESGAALVERVGAFWPQLAHGRHVVITHGGPLKICLALAGMVPIDLLRPAPATGSITRVERFPQSVAALYPTPW